MKIIGRAVAAGMIVAIAGTIPRNLLFAANLRYATAVPWAVPAIAAYLWWLWRYLDGRGGSASSAPRRKESLRARPIGGPVWAWALMAGGLGIVALVLGLRLANRMLVLPDQRLPDVGAVPETTFLALLIAAAPVAGIVEEAAFRGYMQTPIERRFGLIVAILISGTMFALSHLDFTFILWPYYVAVAAIYSTVTSLSKSILPAIVLHTAGNMYSNFDLWLHGSAEWQASAGQSLIWNSGVDTAFVVLSLVFVLTSVLAISAYVKLGRVATMAAAVLFAAIAAAPAFAQSVRVGSVHEIVREHAPKRLFEPHLAVNPAIEVPRGSRALTVVARPTETAALRMSLVSPDRVPSRLIGGPVPGDLRFSVDQPMAGVWEINLSNSQDARTAARLPQPLPPTHVEIDATISGAGPPR